MSRKAGQTMTPEQRESMRLRTIAKKVIKAWEAETKGHIILTESKQERTCVGKNSFGEYVIRWNLIDTPENARLIFCRAHYERFGNLVERVRRNPDTAFIWSLFHEIGHAVYWSDKAKWSQTRKLVGDCPIRKVDYEYLLLDLRAECHRLMDNGRKNEALQVANELDMVYRLQAKEYNADEYAFKRLAKYFDSIGVTY